MNKLNVRQYNLQIPAISVRDFYDLGAEITEEFEILYHKFFNRRKIELTSTFVDRSKRLFANFDRENKTVLSDSCFGNFTPITEKLIANRQYRYAFELWYKIINFVKDWENSGSETLHKGTPYYFSAVSAILSGDFDSALISMHLALEEDKVNHKNYKETPAYCFLTLNDQKPNQYFKPFVDGMIGFLRDRLDGQGNEQGRYKGHYQAKRGGTLTYEQLRQKFLDDGGKSEELKFFFAYSIIKIRHLRINQVLNRDEKIVAPVIFSHSLGPFLIMIEMLLKIKYPEQINYQGPWDFGNVFQKLASNEGWKIDSLKSINDFRDQNFSVWVDGCLDKRSLVGDFTLAYGLRNFTFHQVESQQKLWERFTDVLQSVLNCFFRTIEIL
jgi:hypothetical protein